jgi:hypothetical protein
MAVKPIDQQIKAFEKTLHKIKAIEVPRAISRALNDTGRSVRKRVGIGIAAKTRIPSGLIKKKIWMKNSTSKTPQVRMRAYLQGIAVISMMRKSTISGRLKPGKKRRRGGVKAAGRTFSSAFVAAGTSRYSRGVLNGKPQVLQRKGSAQYPLEVVKIPIRREVKSILPRVSRREMKNGYPKRLAHELKFRIDKYRVK